MKGLRTKGLRDPYVACDFVVTGRVESTEVAALDFLLGVRGPRESRLEHAGGADIAVATSPLQCAQNSLSACRRPKDSPHGGASHAGTDGAA